MGCQQASLDSWATSSFPLPRDHLCRRLIVAGGITSALAHGWAASAQPVLQPPIQISQGTSIIRSFSGSVSISSAGSPQKTVLVKGDVGIPVDPGTVLYLAPKAKVTLKCATGQIKTVVGPVTIALNTLCPVGGPMANKGIDVDGRNPVTGEPALVPSPVRGLW